MNIERHINNVLNEELNGLLEKYLDKEKLNENVVLKCYDKQKLQQEIEQCKINIEKIIKNLYFGEVLRGIQDRLATKKCI